MKRLWGAVLALSLAAWAGPAEDLLSPEEHVRAAAVRQIVSKPQLDALPALLERLRAEPSPWMRRAMLEALPALRPLCGPRQKAEVQAALEAAAATDASPSVRAFALLTLDGFPELAGTHDERFQGLLGLLDEAQDSYEFQGILDSLIDFEHAGRLEAVAERVNLPGERGWWARVALARLAPARGEPLVLQSLQKALASSAIHQRRIALEWLRDLGPAAWACRDQILELTADAQLQSEAVRTWLALGGELRLVEKVLVTSCREADCARAVADLLEKGQTVSPEVAEQLQSTRFPWLRAALLGAPENPATAQRLWSQSADPLALGALLNAGQTKLSGEPQNYLAEVLQQLEAGRWSGRILLPLREIGASPEQLVRAAAILLARADPQASQDALRFLRMESQRLRGQEIVQLLHWVSTSHPEPALRDQAADELYYSLLERQSLPVLDYVVYRKGTLERLDSPPHLRKVLTSRYRHQLATCTDPAERLKLIGALYALVEEPASLVAPLLATPARGQVQLYAQILERIGPEVVAERSDPAALVRLLAEMPPREEGYFDGGPVVEALLCCESRPEVELPWTRGTRLFRRDLGLPEPTPSPYAEQHPLTRASLGKLQGAELHMAITGMGLNAGPRALPLLLELAEDPMWQYEALRILRDLGERNGGAGWELVEPVLKRIFERAQPWIKREVAQTAQAYPGYDWGFQRLLELCRGPLRSEALRALTFCRHPGVVPFLASLGDLKLLVDVGSAPARQAAKPILLRQLRSRQPLAALKLLAERRIRCWEARPLVLALLKDPRPTVQLAACEAWWSLSLDCRPLLPVIRRQLASANRHRVLGILTQMGSQGPEASVLIASTLEHFPPEQVSGPLWNAGPTGRRQMLPTFLAYATSTNPRRRQAGLAGLRSVAQLGTDVRPAVREVLAQRSNAELAALLRSLGEPAKQNVSPLSQLLRQLAQGRLEGLETLQLYRPEGRQLAEACWKCVQTRGDLSIEEWRRLLRFVWGECREPSPDRESLVQFALAHKDRRVRVEAAPMVADRLTPTLFREVLEQPEEPG